MGIAAVGSGQEWKDLWFICDNFFTAVFFLEMVRVRCIPWGPCFGMSALMFLLKSMQIPINVSHNKLNVLIETRQYLVMIRCLIFMSKLTILDFAKLCHFVSSNIYVKNDIF